MTLATDRHYFPGNNTPQGFFSYYDQILGQREAKRIICLKGGPGTGKSTLIRTVGETFLELGEDVDFLHCSADESSLDGVVLHGKKVAVIDGTAPHIIDPKSPGAVDRIINLGEHWNEDGIKDKKGEIIDLSEESSGWYKVCYNYLNAAKSVYRSLESIYHDAIESSELYQVVANIIGEEYEGYDISIRPGKLRKLFASAITASGTIHYLESLLSGFPGREEPWKRIYLINTPIGYGNRSFLSIITEGAIYRGLDVEAYYCAMCPEDKIEHLLIPELGIGFVTVNSYHDLDPWELQLENTELLLIDAGDYMDSGYLERIGKVILALEEDYHRLIQKGIFYLEKAKKIHKQVEERYIPHMNFGELNILTERMIEEIKAL